MTITSQAPAVQLGHVGSQRWVGQPFPERYVERLVRIEQQIGTVELERGQALQLELADQPDLGFRAGPQPGRAGGTGDRLEPVRQLAQDAVERLGALASRGSLPPGRRVVRRSGAALKGR